MATTRDILALQLSTMQGVLGALPSDKKRDVVRLWTSLRSALEEKDREIQELRNENQHLRGSVGSAVMPPDRPPSSASVLSIREALEQTLATEAREENELARSSHVLRNLPVEWVLARLRASNDRGNRLGCWLSNNVPAHKQYTKDNLRNTKHPVNNAFLGINPYRHHMAVVAGGRGQLLNAIRPGGGYEVSHLCHQGGCFNPGHVKVELKELNVARNSCQGRVIIVAPDGTTIHPCEHWAWGNGNHPHCILPKVIVDESFAGKWIDMKGGEPRVRTGRST